MLQTIKNLRLIVVIIERCLFKINYQTYMLHCTILKSHFLQKLFYTTLETVMKTGKNIMKKLQSRKQSWLSVDVAKVITIRLLGCENP